MHNTSYERNSRSQKNLPWKWIITVWAILLILIILKSFSGGSSTDDTSSSLVVTPNDQSAVYISMSNATKNRIKTEENLFTTDKSVSVELGWANIANENIKIDLDSNSELTYLWHSNSWESINIVKWRAWIESKWSEATITLKNYDLHLSPQSIVLVEQTGPFSNAYSIAGSITIETKVGSTAIPTWNSVKLLASDLINPSVDLTSWITGIDGSIIELPIFWRNNGKSYIQNFQKEVSSSWSTALTWSWNTWSLALSSEKYIEITDPKANSMLGNKTITIMGNLLSKEVKRVTINNKEASLSFVNGTFVYQNFEVNSDIIDIVYKAYDTSNNLLESWVFTVYGSKNWKNTAGQLIPETFPISSKDVKIISPAENPYTTTESVVRVEWTVPKNTVSYIMVNDYRLQKFTPLGSNWYYFANIANKTMVEWINMYTIKFYSASDALLYTQVFTIVKESKTQNTYVSGETTKQ